MAYMHEERELSLKGWSLNAKLGRESSKPRRYSASYVRNFREEGRSFRSNITIPSTTSSPGYPLYRDEIDPATYSFTSALKELQARSNYSSWDCIMQDGFALNSKWREAERYICNPLSGEVPKECLSAKSLRRRSYSNITSRITMSSSSMSYPSPKENFVAKPDTSSEEEMPDLQIRVKKMVGSISDVGIQSTLGCSSPTGSSNPAAPPAKNASTIKIKFDKEELPHKLSSQIMPETEIQVKETRDKDDKKTDKKEEQAHIHRQSGCFSWVTRRQQREKHHSKKRNMIFLPHIIGC